MPLAACDVGRAVTGTVLLTFHAVGYEYDLASNVRCVRRLQILERRVVNNVCGNATIGRRYGFAERRNVELQVAMAAYDGVCADAFPAAHRKFLYPDLVESKRLEPVHCPVSCGISAGGTRHALGRDGDQFLEKVVCPIAVQRRIAKRGGRCQLRRRKVPVSLICSLCMGWRHDQNRRGYDK